MDYEIRNYRIFIIHWRLSCFFVYKQAHFTYMYICRSINTSLSAAFSCFHNFLPLLENKQPLCLPFWCATLSIGEGSQVLSELWVYTLSFMLLCESWNIVKIVSKWNTHEACTSACFTANVSMVRSLHFARGRPLFFPPKFRIFLILCWFFVT